MCVGTLALTAAPARAGSYAVTYTAALTTGGSTTHYAATAGATPWPGSVNAYSTSTLTIQAAPAWSPQNAQDTAPTCAIVQEGASDGGGGSGGLGAAMSANNGFGDGPGPSDRVVTQNGVPIYESLAASSGGQHYTVTSGGAAIQVPGRTLSVTYTGGGTGNCGFGYGVTVYPVTISLAGTTTDIANGRVLKVLTGQQVTATLSDGGAPGMLSNFQWSTTGATAPNPFWTWDSSAPNATNPTQFVPLNQAEMTGSSFSFYDEHNGDQVTVMCTATYTPTVGPPMQVTAKSLPITYVKPTTTWAVNQVFSNFHPGFYADYIHGYMGAGELWGPITINEPTLFTSGGVNTIGFGTLVQIASLGRSNTRVPLNNQPATYSKIDVLFPNNTASFFASPTGLDGSFPYYYGYYQNASGAYTLVNGNYGWLAYNQGYSGDGPQEPFTVAALDNGGNAWDAATAADTFNTWVMYKPAPVPGQGTGSVYVPLQMLTWNWGGSANLVQLNATQSAWNAMGSSFNGGAPSSTDVYPTWSYEIPIGFTIGP